mmetsp:Transcript_4912/g.21030  ORF Transcript_4912/g.21030 Transcript_4912/m.21030 type:complete len:259 (-) Transcript_4912:144-920(-)
MASASARCGVTSLGQRSTRLSRACRQVSRSSHASSECMDSSSTSPTERARTGTMASRCRPRRHPTRRDTAPSTCTRVVALPAADFFPTVERMDPTMVSSSASPRCGERAPSATVARFFTAGSGDASCARNELSSVLASSGATSTSGRCSREASKSSACIARPSALEAEDAAARGSITASATTCAVGPSESLMIVLIPMAYTSRSSSSALASSSTSSMFSCRTRGFVACLTTSDRQRTAMEMTSFVLSLRRRSRIASQI